MSFPLDLRFPLDTIADEFPRDRRRESGAQRSLESAEILYFLTTDGDRHSGTFSLYSLPQHERTKARSRGD